VADPGGVICCLFDIDGTLIDTGGASDRAWRRAFLELHGVEVKVPDFTGKGVPDPMVGRQCFRGAIGREPTDEEMAPLMALRQRYLAEEVASSPGYRVMPGAEALLQRLGEEGMLVGLITGNTEPAAQIKLERAGLNRYFAFGGFGSDAERRVDVCRKALERAEGAAGGALARDRCLALGDTPVDIEAGHGAGIRVIGVATGEYTTAQLDEAGADWAVADLTGELPI
jgi:beta-phosphoglucomutase-like phosphatase (HAD superfamily)